MIILFISILLFLLAVLIDIARNNSPKVLIESQHSFIENSLKRRKASLENYKKELDEILIKDGFDIKAFDKECKEAWKKELEEDYRTG